MYQVPMTVSPLTLIEKLSLDLRSIRVIFDYKMKAIKGEKHLLKIAN